MSAEPVQLLRCGRHHLDLSHPHVMGVLNLTPDSFSDGGQLLDDHGPVIDAVIDRAAAMLAAGASILDVGGESTRPGAAPVSVQQELDRVCPVVEALQARFDCVISVDTSTPELIRAVADTGAGLINDVRALHRPGAIEAAAASGLPVCLMHMQGEPGSMQDAPHYADVVREVRDYLLDRARDCELAGIRRGAILLDPGFGFGKTQRHNYRLLDRLEELVATGYPVLVGMSRKSMIGAATGRKVAERSAGSVAAAALAVYKGARVVRAHDVGSTIDAVLVARACRHPQVLTDG